VHLGRASFAAVRADYSTRLTVGCSGGYRFRGAITGDMSSRAEREKAAYDEQGVFERSHGWHVRFRHVFECPNTVRNEARLEERLRRGVAGGRALDIGCGDGASSEALLALGAAYVLGIDVSETFIAKARAREVPGRLEFVNGDVGAPVDGAFDVIFGRAILHHLDYRAVLERLHERNLRPGGSMIFMEPLGSNLLIRAFGAVARGAHTPDERSFDRRDLGWFRERFPRLEILPVNYLSFPAAIVSSYVFRRADNPVLRLCDRADDWLARHVRGLVPRFRQAIFVVGK
jgi:SAM-dependent methyltransferase